MSLSLGRSAVVTDTGRRRRRNEDSYVCEPPLFAVADGMGGAQAGEVASRLAAAVLEEANGDELREERIVELIQEANRRVFQRSSEDPAASGMGTTMTVAVTGRAGTVSIGHVGDSRAYRVRAGRLEQLTKDHSLVGELMRSGKLSPEEAETHPQRSVITRAVGTEPDVDVDTFTVDTEPGDVFLLCSDGLTDMVSDEGIQSVFSELLSAQSLAAQSPAAQSLPAPALSVEREGELEGAARRLVELANRSGGEDNITVVVFEIVDEAGPEVENPAEDTVEDATSFAPDEQLEPKDAPEDVEDTLDELDAVSVVETVPVVETAPVAHTAVIPAAAIEEHLRQEQSQQSQQFQPAQQSQQAQQVPDRQRHVLPLVLLVLLLAVIAVLVVWGLLR